MLYSTPTSYRPLRTAPALTWSVHLCVQLPASFRLTSFVSTVYLLLPLHGYSSTPFESIRYALLSPRWSVEPPPGENQERNHARTHSVRLARPARSSSSRSGT